MNRNTFTVISKISNCCNDGWIVFGFLGFFCFVFFSFAVDFLKVDMNDLKDTIVRWKLLGK